MTDSWTSELELVARLARVRPTSGDLERASALVAEGIDWERATRLARHHRVAPLVQGNLEGLTGAEVPEPVAGRLRRLRVSIARSNLAKYADWLRISDAFLERGLAAVTLKGFPTAIRLYGGMDLRPVGDLDFLVRDSDVPEALGVLRDMGYRPVPDWERALEHVDLDHLLRSAGEMPLIGEGRTPVDLHWRAEWNGLSFPVDEILRAPATLTVDTRNVLVPSPDVDLAFLLLHAHASLWLRLRWLVDVVEALDALPPGDAEETLRRIRELGAGPALGSALWIVETLWGRRPESCAGLPRHSGPTRGMKDFLRMALEQDHDWWQSQGRQRLTATLRSRRALKGSIPRAITASLRPCVRDWAVVRLPRRLRFAYWLVRPFRLLGRATSSLLRTPPR